MFKITSKNLLIGAALVGAWLIYQNQNKAKKTTYDPLEPVYQDGQRIIRPLSELNYGGGGSIFEIYGNGK